MVISFCMLMQDDGPTFLSGPSRSGGRKSLQGTASAADACSATPAATNKKALESTAKKAPEQARTRPSLVSNSVCFQFCALSIRRVTVNVNTSRQDRFCHFSEYCH